MENLKTLDGLISKGHLITETNSNGLNSLQLVMRIIKDTDTKLFNLSILIIKKIFELCFDDKTKEKI